MLPKKRIHITVDQETHKYLTRIQKTHDTTFSDVVRLLVEENKGCKKRIEKKVLKEVIDHVLESYLSGQYFSKN